jgi:predicted nucleic acid-binding protein
VYLLDTNVISELRRTRPHGSVLAWFSSVEDRLLYASVVSFGDLQVGIEITREQNPARAVELEAWLNQIVTVWNVLPVDTATFRLWAKLMHRKSDTIIIDAMIAAAALVHGLTVATRNERHFREFNVPLINPFNTNLTAR